MRSSTLLSASAATLATVSAVLLVLSDSASAKHAHKVSAAPEGAPATITGSVVVAEPETVATGAAAGSTDEAPPKKTLSWSVEIKKDVVLWDELLNDGVVIESCTETSVVLKGDGLDASDYYEGGTFVIDVEDWEKNCGAPKLEAGVPAEDDVLFYVVESVVASEGRVELAIKTIDGAEVAPEVSLEFGEGAPVPAEDVGTVQVTGGTSAASRLLMAGSDVSLPFTSRISLSKTLAGEAELFPGAELSFKASVSASIGKFKFVRLIGLQFRWDQRFESSTEIKLDAQLEFTADTSGELFKQGIPGFGFSAKIPFIGRATAGAFVQLEWVADVEIAAKMTAAFNAKHQVHQVANARLLPPKLTTRDLIPKNDQTTTKGTVDFFGSAEATITGFVGVRPALGVEFKIRSTGLGANVGFSVGVEAQATVNTQAFSPVTNGLLVGKCEDCHKLEADFAIKAKDLGIQLLLGRKESEIILVADIFRIKIATFCGIPATCPAEGSVGEIVPASATGQITKATSRPPTTTASPNKNRCKRCKRNSDCGSALRCKDSGRFRLIRRRQPRRCMPPRAGRRSC